jgi:hypothetical protein
VTDRCQFSGECEAFAMIEHMESGLPKSMNLLRELFDSIAKRMHWNKVK